MTKNRMKSKSKIMVQLPEPTKDQPYIQIDFVFQRIKALRAKSTSDISYAYNFYTKVFLETTNNYNEKWQANTPFYINEHWDSLALVKIKNYFDEFHSFNNTDRLRSKTVSKHLNILNRVIKYSISHGYIKNMHLIMVKYPQTRNETKNTTAYSDNEISLINNLLSHEVSLLNKKNRIIKNEVNGIDPRILPIDKTNHTNNEYGWANLDNLFWYFKNEMGSNLLDLTNEEKKKHSHFIRAVITYHQNVLSINDKWGLPKIISIDILMPLAMQLILETGLNPISLLELKADCFQESHPLTGGPYLQYYKERSQGDMEMHLSTNNPDPKIRFLKEKQAVIIRRTINKILEVTKTIRKKASKNVREYLLIYQSPSIGMLGKIKTININLAETWCRKKVSEYKLKDDHGEHLKLSMVRFRSTKITEMVRSGEDFFAIQAQFGHKNIETTINYINLQKIELHTRNKISGAIQNIHNNAISYKAQQASSRAEEYHNTPLSTHVYKTPLANCKNVFDPPDEVKRAKNYQVGSACTRYNMCLFCHNIIITRQHLPMLISYYRSLIAINKKSLSELPNSHFYDRTMSILESILNPEKSEFSKDDIIWATEQSYHLDNPVDSLTYRSVTL